MKPSIWIMFKKKSQGLSITTIVVAVIALVVIIVIIALLTGKLGDFRKGLDDVTRFSDKDCKQVSNYQIAIKDECVEKGGEYVETKDTLLLPNMVCCSK